MDGGSHLKRWINTVVWVVVVVVVDAQCVYAVDCYVLLTCSGACWRHNILYARRPLTRSSQHAAGDWPVYISCVVLHYCSAYVDSAFYPFWAVKWASDVVLVHDIMFSHSGLDGMWEHHRLNYCEDFNRIFSTIEMSIYPSWVLHWVQNLLSTVALLLLDTVPSFHLNFLLH